MDRVVLDLSKESVDTPSVFIRKDWVNILDSSNGSYSSNSAQIDCSQIANSDKYQSWREAYLNIPILLTVNSTGIAANGLVSANCAYSIGLKNWYGQAIHSIMVQYNGVTVVQQTQFSNFYNYFRLLSTMSWDDVLTQGPSIGFYPDDSTSWTFNQAAASTSGRGICNNTNSLSVVTGGTIGAPVGAITGTNNWNSGAGNYGFLKRQTYINFDPAGIPGAGTYAALQTDMSAKALRKSMVLQKRDAAVGTPGIYQLQVNAIVYLRHLHSMFERMRLTRGALLQLTLTYNNSFASVAIAGGALVSINSISGGAGGSGSTPFMMASCAADNGGRGLGTVASTVQIDYSIGNTCLTTNMLAAGANLVSTLARQVSLYIPLYQFNPFYESEYIDEPIKSINYTDIYQYQQLNVGSSSTFNYLVTNGLRGLKSILIVPFLTGTEANLGLIYPQFQSPFDTAPATTGPLIQFSNFNVLVSGSNVIQTSEQYSYEQFLQQMYGSDALNAGMIDGSTSGLIDFMKFQTNHCFYYVDLSRMLVTEKDAAKSVSIQGYNTSAKSVDLYIFLEFETSFKINVINGKKEN